MDTHSLLILGHIIGTVLGVGGATMIEIHLNMALRDGTMDLMERSFLGIDFLLTRIGMGIGLLTGAGFVVEYILNNQLFRLQDGVFWAKMLIIVIIIINAYLLHKHKISLYWGSAFSFVSWWTALILGTFLTSNIKILPAEPVLSTLSILVFYAIVVTISAQILHRIREHIKTRPVV